MRQPAGRHRGDDHYLGAERRDEFDQFGSQCLIARDLHFPPVGIERERQQLRGELLGLVAGGAEQNAHAIIRMTGRRCAQLSHLICDFTRGRDDIIHVGFVEFAFFVVVAS